VIVTVANSAVGVGHWLLKGGLLLLEQSSRAFSYKCAVLLRLLCSIQRLPDLYNASFSSLVHNLSNSRLI